MRLLLSLLTGTAVLLSLLAPAAADVDELPGFDRSLHLEHAKNARDVGGWQTADGRWCGPGSPTARAGSAT